MRRRVNPVLAFFASMSSVAAQASAQAPGQELGSGLARLLTAYPQHIDRIDGRDLVWKDGTRMIIDGARGPDGRSSRDHETMLATADIADSLATPYPIGRAGLPPAKNSDPGRARNAAFFDKMYGSCRAGAVVKSLVDVAWLPKKGGGRIKATSINGVADRLAAVSRELDELPSSFDRYLLPAGGTYACRPIAGTDRVSAHGYGIAIDIAVATTDYWRWAAPKSAGPPVGTSADAASPDIPYKNRVPFEIVEIFERHGFIWGGKWYHYDTMHFEYRPELINPELLTPSKAP